MDVRIGRQQLRHGGPQDRFGCVLAGRDADGAGRLLAQFAEGGELSIDIVEPRPDRIEAGARPPRSATTLRVVRVEQPKPEPLFSPRIA